MPVSHRYTAGLAGEKFFRAIKDRGVLLATHCDNCDVTYCPATAFCQRCLSHLDDYFETGPDGTLESFTVVHKDFDDRTLAEPQVVGIVKIRGADTVMVHRLDPAARTALRIGMPVEPVFEAKSARTGSLNDIRHFRPKRPRA